MDSGNSATLFNTIQRPTLVRDRTVAEQVAFVGGLPGCGKTLLTPIVSSFEKVEVQKIDYNIEHMAAARYLGAVERDVSTFFLRMMTDVNIYNMMLSREVNLRVSDLTSVFQNPQKARYFKRLFRKGEEATVVETIRREKPTLLLTTHNSLTLCEPLFEALGARAKFIEFTRHPLYMLRQWFLYVDRYGEDPRDFSIWYQYNGKNLPFFARGWEDQFIRANSMDRAILSISHLLKLNQEIYGRLKPEFKKNVTFVPFERFVLSPEPYIETLTRFLNTRPSKATAKELKRQKVPRKKIADGINLKIYRTYGWKPPQAGKSESDELTERYQFAAEKASPEGMRVLADISRWYEDHFLPGSDVRLKVQ